MRVIRKKLKPLFFTISILFFAGVLTFVTELGERTKGKKSDHTGDANSVEQKGRKSTTDREIETDFMWPLKIADVSSVFGLRKVKTEKGDDENFHTGIDIRRPEGTPVLAAAAGKVIFSGDGEDGYGVTVIIDHGGGVKSLYAHNQENLVKEGDSVKRWSKIAKVGNSGRATGYHLHFEIHIDGIPVDPEKYLPPRLR